MKKSREILGVRGAPSRDHMRTSLFPSRARQQAVWHGRPACALSRGRLSHTRARSLTVAARNRRLLFAPPGRHWPAATRRLPAPDPLEFCDPLPGDDGVDADEACFLYAAGPSRWQALSRLLLGLALSAGLAALVTMLY